MRFVGVMLEVLHGAVAKLSLPEEEAEPIASLLGGLFDAFEEIGRPAERSEAKRGSPRDPLADLSEQLSTAVGAIESMRVGFRRVADERDALKKAAEYVQSAIACSDVHRRVLRASARMAEVLAGRVPLPPDEAPFDASEHERPRPAMPPKVIVLGPPADHRDPGPNPSFPLPEVSR